MAIKQIQLPRYVIRKSKSEAIETMVGYINQHSSEFHDGDEIAIRYLANDGVTLCSVNAIVEFKGATASLSVEIGEKDTLKIVDSENEPVDKKSLWLTDWDDDETYPASDLKSEVKYLKAQLKVMQEMLYKHDYALSNTLAGGDIIVNSEKYDLENKYDPEMPEDMEYDPEYDTGDTVITSFEVYVGNTPLSTYSTGEVNLYRHQNYFLKFKVFNAAMKEVDPSGCSINYVCLPREIATINELDVLYAETSGDTEISATLYTLDGDELSNRYAITFDYNEKPDYETYEEPNVHHMLIKKADTLDILQDNSRYLLEGEFCWCIDENALYLKAKAKNGTTQLFKINGEGTITPTGETTVEYFVDDEGILQITCYDDSVYVDNDGILHLVGGVNEDGILLLNDTTPN